MAEHDFSRDSAIEAADRDDLGAWVADFLSSPGSDNAALAHKLTEGNPSWLGPVQLPIDQLHRLAGPEGDPVLEVVEDDEWRDDVDEMAGKIDDGWEPPPMIVTFRDEQLMLEDGNHRVEGLRRAGHTEAWSIVRFEDDEHREEFLSTHASARP